MSTAPVVNTSKKSDKVTNQVLAQITNLQNTGKLTLPENYNAANALNSAWLALQEVQNLDKKPLIVNGELSGIVTPASVANALHDMVIQGLNPSKKQCYFIVYGSKLVMQRSYFGEVALAMRVKPNVEIYFDVIHEGEEITTKKARTASGFATLVDSHALKFPRTGKIVGAYCGIIDTKTGEYLGDDVMDIDRIKKSWQMSKTYKADGNGTHNKFEAEMALRTVIRHRCKHIINTANDSMLRDALMRQELDSADSAIDETLAIEANAQVIDVTELVHQESATDAEIIEETKAEETKGEEAPY